MENRAESHFILFLQNLENDILPQLTPQYQNQLQMGVARYFPALEIKTQWPCWPCFLSFLDFCTSKDDNCITYLMPPVHSISFQIHLPTSDSDSNPSHNTRVHDPFISCRPIQNKIKSTVLEWLFSYRSACSSKGDHTGHRHSLPLWEGLYVGPSVLLSPLLLHSPVS